MFNEVMMMEIDDSIGYRINTIDVIHEDSEYNGFRLSLTAFLDESRIPLKIDITTGDIITPGEIGFDYPMLLENRSISIYCYNLETVLAEKLETILSRSIANTRMRDFYDISILISTKQNMFTQDVFRAAFSATSRFRDSQYSQDEIQKTIQKIKSSSELESNWFQYQRRNDFAHELAYSDVCSSLEKLIGLL